MFAPLFHRIKAMPAKAWAWIALSLTILLSLFFFAALRQLRFDYNFEKFFPNHDPQTQFYHAHRARFESDNDFLLLAIEHKKGIYHLDFLKKIEQLRLDIETKVPYIQRVVAITNAKEAKLYAFGGLIFDPYIHFKTQHLPSDARRIA